MKLINGAMFSKMIISASKLLELNRENIDALNVFPVPDGDTGTNMSLTFKSAITELLKSPSNSLRDIADSVSRGTLRGARGNSGVITSQVFRGLCSVLKEENECDTATFARALRNANTVAYSAVSKPKEGTILTVCRCIAECAEQSKAVDFEEFFEEIVIKGEIALNETPNLLPVLKKAGVVDSGGMGLLTLFKGMYKAIVGENIEGVEMDAITEKKVTAPENNVFSVGSIEYGYCTEFFITHIKKRTTLASINSLREFLMTIGDCVLVVGDLEFVKVHVHTNKPGVALSKALELGELDRVKIDNLFEQNRELLKQNQVELKKMGMLAVCSGEGFSAIYKDVGVDEIIGGGQTMNPSISDIANAINKINAENVFVFPNNKNIILAAEQSINLVEGKNVIVIPTLNMPQGLAAAIAFNTDLDVDTNKLAMEEAIKTIVSGQVTYAVRNSKVGSMVLKKSDIIGLNDKKILVKANSIEDCLLKLIDNLKTRDHAVLNLYYGEDITEEDATAIQAKVAEKFQDLEVDLYPGGQAVYYFIVSLE